MKSTMSIIGILLIVFGIVMLAYQGFTYTKREKIAEIGDMQLTTDKQEKVYVSPLVGGLTFAAGVILVVVARRGK